MGMEHVHGVDVSWMAHEAPKGLDHFCLATVVDFG